VPGRDDVNQLSGAVPAATAGQLPSTLMQYRALQGEIERSRPVVADAQRQARSLEAEAAQLRQRLIETAARIQDLEQKKIWIDADVATLSREETVLSANFQRQRGEVASLLAVFERMQHDVPPAMAVSPNDAVAAAHASMLLAPTLPRLYTAAAELARRLQELRRTHGDLVLMRVQASGNAVALESARGELDQLLAMKSRAADAADARYGDLSARLATASEQAANLDGLLRRVAALRARPAAQSLVVVGSRSGSGGVGLQRGSLLRPVVGRISASDGPSTGASGSPGVTFVTPPAAQVVAPADSRVLFAGPYHKNGEVLILQSLGGYDLVLAGLEHVDVRVGDQLLAGEPVGGMPRTGTENRLYFELRQNGKGVDPRPWLEIEPRKVTRS
jgi:septal ring factor EnvC (AmiA/AmiB activator)